MGRIERSRADSIIAVPVGQLYLHRPSDRIGCMQVRCSCRGTGALPLPEAEIDRRCVRLWPEAAAVLVGLASLDLPCWLTGRLDGDDSINKV